MTAAPSPPIVAGTDRLGPIRGLYPQIEPYRTGWLRVSPIHDIYYEECGNPKGKPVLVIHGGPGGGSNPAMRRYHDPAKYRIVLVDQRGCGRSTPNASIEDNTTWSLVADMERVRDHLHIDAWQLFGGSWGSTLALTYAEMHADRVTELVLRGIFLLRKAEIDWFYQEGASWIYPDAFENYLAPIAPDERGNLVEAYHRLLTGDSRDVQLETARAWSTWEGATLSLLPDDDRVRRFGANDYALAFARIECHYFVNRGFFETDTYLLDNAAKIAHVPCTIVHGRYDVVTPLKNAWDLCKVLPKADVRIVPNAGHAMSEPGIVHELVLATDRYAEA